MTVGKLLIRIGEELERHPMKGHVRIEEVESPLNEDGEIMIVGEVTEENEDFDLLQPYLQQQAHEDVEQLEKLFAGLSQKERTEIYKTLANIVGAYKEAWLDPKQGWRIEELLEKLPDDWRTRTKNDLIMFFSFCDEIGLTEDGRIAVFEAAARLVDTNKRAKTMRQRENTTKEVLRHFR